MRSLVEKDKSAALFDVALENFLGAAERMNDDYDAIIEQSMRIARRPPNMRPPSEDASEGTVLFGFILPKELQQPLFHAWQDSLNSFYGALNRYASVFDALADHETRRGMKLRSMKRWLRQMSERFPEVEGEIEHLEKARNFRAKYVDHPQEPRASMYWMTGETVLHGFPITVPMYVGLPPDGELWPAAFSGLNPYEPGWRPPVVCTGYGVPPCFMCTWDTFARFVWETSSRFREPIGIPTPRARSIKPPFPEGAEEGHPTPGGIVAEGVDNIETTE